VTVANLRHDFLNHAADLRQGAPILFCVLYYCVLYNIPDLEMAGGGMKTSRQLFKNPDYDEAFLRTFTVPVEDWHSPQG